MIYFIQAGSGGPIKIGFTHGSVAYRLNVINTCNHEPCFLMGVIDGGANKESLIHKRFSAYRKKGEWFYPEKPILEFINHEAQSSKALSKEFARFISINGNVTRLAKALKITKGAVSQWDNVPLARVPAVSAFTGIPREELRPDVFCEAA